MNAPLLDPFSQTAASPDALRREIARLPLTMQPALNQQVNAWHNLFPFEQKRTAEFLRGVLLFSPVELDALTRHLRELESQMGVAHSNFSVAADTMANASQLARSPYYIEWRHEVQKVFAAIESNARNSAIIEPPASRLLLLLLPEALPITSIAGQKPWDSQGVEFRIGGDPCRISEIALRSVSELPDTLAAREHQDPANASADCWLIDADSGLGSMLGQPPAPASILEYHALKEFRDQFLAQVNTVPKDIEATDRILSSMRKQNWDAWWPTSLHGQTRLRSFIVELFLSGNGALIFSNAFVQWACSEAMRRARPRLVIARFGLRAKPKPFTGIAIFENQQKISAMRDDDDPEGSAIDALILAKYVWLSALRYSDRSHTTCVCVCESSRTAYLIAPDAMRPPWPATRSITPDEICDWMRQALV